MLVASTTSPLVLLIEDDASMRKFLKAFLSGAGFRIEEAKSGEQALTQAARNRPDVVILDLGLPDMDGQEVLTKLRDWLIAPIIILSVRNQDAQKIAALDHGADDYLVKPFSTGELLARIRVALRHADKVNNGNELAIFESGDLKVDFAARCVYMKGAEIRLTRIEYKLLTTLVRNVGKVLTHQFLLGEVWGPEQADKFQHLRVFMAGLRRKIEANPAQPRYLVTEQGVGYRLMSH